MNENQFKFNAGMKAVATSVIIKNRLSDLIAEYVAAGIKTGNDEDGELANEDCVLQARAFIKEEDLHKTLEGVIAEAVMSGFVTGVNLTCINRKRKARNIFRKYFPGSNEDIDQLIGDKQQLKDLGL